MFSEHFETLIAKKQKGGQGRYLILKQVHMFEEK